MSAIDRAVRAALVLVAAGALGLAVLHASGDHPHTESVTLWTDKGELFMEYQVPVAGKPARFTAHLTELTSFRAVVKAKVTLRLKPVAGGEWIVGTVEQPARPGIFQPVVTFPVPGEYSGELVVAGEDLDDRFELESVRVHAEGQPIPHGEEEPGKPETVSFLKEQQWKIPFRTVVIGRRKLVHSIHALGEVKDKPGHSAAITAPVEGRIVSQPPVLGQVVKQGDVLAEIAPFLTGDVDRPHLEQEVTQAEAELVKARADLTRIQRLVSQGVMPVKELVTARTQLTIAESKVRSAREHQASYQKQQSAAGSGVSAHHFQVRAPIGGEVTRVDFTREQLVTRDRPLLELDDLSRVWLEFRVFEPDLPEARETTSAVFQLPGRTRPVPLEELSGAIVHVGHHIDAASRTAPVIFEVNNPKTMFPIGGFVEADLLTRRSGEYLAVPVHALQEDGSRTVVFVHTAGEEFEKREVVTGLVDRGYAAVTRGLKPGERVVTTGAYEIKLSTLSGAIPEHGHTH